LAFLQIIVFGFEETEVQDTKLFEQNRGFYLKETSKKLISSKPGFGREK